MHLFLHCRSLLESVEVRCLMAICPVAARTISRITPSANEVNQNDADHHGGVCATRWETPNDWGCVILCGRDLGTASDHCLPTCSCRSEKSFVVRSGEVDLKSERRTESVKVNESGKSIEM